MTTAAQFAGTPNKGTPGYLTAANTTRDGTGATGRQLLFTAGASGSVLPGVQLQPRGTNVQTVLRFFRNNGSDPETAANNSLIAEQVIPATTASDTTSLPDYYMDFAQKFDGPGLVLASGERLYMTLATAVSAGIQATPINGGDL